MDTTKKYIRHLSLCSGYEGIGLGLRRVLPNVREVAHVEIEAFAVANLVAKMETGEVHPAPVFTNLKEFPFGKFRGCVDIMSGGFPCQPFSAAGKKRGTEDPRHLFPYILEGIKQCRPAVVFLENVEGIISSKTADGESVLKYVLQSLEEVGYRATAGVFSASEVGAPHQRKRVFIMGYTIDNGHLRLKQIQEGKWGNIQLREAIAMQNWPTPTTSDHKGSGPTVIRKDGKDRSNGRLDYATETRSGQPVRTNSSTTGKNPEQWGTPSANDHKGHPGKNSKQKRITKQVSNPNRLNPSWVEQLMGLEVGWTQLPTEWTD